MHLPIILTLLTTHLTTSLALPVETIEERHILTETHILPRQQQSQQNIPQLLSLASLAGVTLPTDPAVLISLYPVAAQLQSFLPTSSVLSVLETAAPPSFLSNIVHDPSYAASFEEAFAKGSSPSWFNALPTDVKNYLHTYSNYGGVATAVGELSSVARGATTATGAGSGSESGGTATMASSGASQMSGTSPSSSSGGSGGTASGTTANTQATGSSTASTGGATSRSGSLALGLLGAAGVLGLAIML